MPGIQGPGSPRGPAISPETRYAAHPSQRRQGRNEGLSAHWPASAVPTPSPFHRTQDGVFEGKALTLNWPGHAPILSLPRPSSPASSRKTGSSQAGVQQRPGDPLPGPSTTAPCWGRSVSNTLSQSFEMHFNWLVSSITNPCLISRVLLLPSIGGFHTWDRCNKGAQSGRSLPQEGFLAAEAPAAAGAHQDTLALMGKAGPPAPPHQCGSRPREGGREGGRQPSGHCSGGADSEAWSNNGFRTSISPVCERWR